MSAITIATLVAVFGLGLMVYLYNKNRMSNLWLAISVLVVLMGALGLALQSMPVLLTAMFISFISSSVLASTKRDRRK